MVIISVCGIEVMSSNLIVHLMGVAQRLEYEPEKLLIVVRFHSPEMQESGCGEIGRRAGFRNQFILFFIIGSIPIIRKYIFGKSRNLMVKCSFDKRNMGVRFSPRSRKNIFL